MAFKHILLITAIAHLLRHSSPTRISHRYIKINPHGSFPTFCSFCPVAIGIFFSCRHRNAAPMPYGPLQAHEQPSRYSLRSSSRNSTIPHQAGTSAISLVDDTCPSWTFWYEGRNLPDWAARSIRDNTEQPRARLATYAERTEVLIGVEFEAEAVQIAAAFAEAFAALVVVPIQEFARSEP